jgi:2',3'-cyclic-nucleotide 2'-phosphodiesterase (5'-nucleotidase family)
MTHKPIVFLLATLLFGAAPIHAAPADLPASTSFPVALPQPDSFTLTLLHTNDLHGHILPFPYTEVGKSSIENPSRGGAARRATLIRSLRSKIHNPTLLVDAGDTFTRGPLSNAYEGVADVEAMNAVGYELAAIGNNEFKGRDATQQNDFEGAQTALRRVIKRAKFPWICANVRASDGGLLEGVQPYIVRQWDGVRVGFLGLTTKTSGGYPQTKGFVFTDPVEAAKEWIPKARRDCDILIALTHIGSDQDMLLARETTGLDAIVGGHSHTFLYTPLTAVNPDGAVIPIVQDGEFGVNLGRFDLKFLHGAKGWTLDKYHDEIIPIDKSTKDAPDVAAAVAPFTTPFLRDAGTVAQVGATPDERLRITTQVLVDAMRRSTGAAVAINPSGGGMFGAFHTRTISYYDLYAAMPFANHIATASLTPSEIRALIAKKPKSVVSGEIPAGDAPVSVAFEDYEATSEYGILSTNLTDTHIDIRDSVRDFLHGH